MPRRSDNDDATCGHRTCAVTPGRWLLTFGVALWTLGCGGRAGGQVSDAGQPAQLDVNASTPLFDGTVYQMPDGSLDAARGSETGQPTQSDANAPPPEDAMPLGDAMPPVLCDPIKCAPGCCGPAGCLSGTTSTACGFGGQSCTDCTMLGLDCVSPMAGESGGVCGALDAGITADGAPACGPATCAGCCAGSICVAGTTNASCGSHGLACEECTGTNVTCVAQGGVGVCVGMGASCGPTNCLGCCDANGICQDPSDIGACGTAGTSCQFCLAGQACNSGQCQTASGCGPYNCPGCCQENTCLSGSLDKSACGSGGAQCQSCPEACIPVGLKNGGSCNGGGSASCGCHDFALQLCQPGNTETYCSSGAPGGACGTCGGSCATGACVGGPLCSASNCGGCCMPDGTCWTGERDNAHCGGESGPAQRGSLCIDCGPGYACDTSNDTPTAICKVACSPQNCQGCCVGGICSTGADPSSCGIGGNACTQCAQGQSCLSGACVTLSQCGPTLCAGCCQNDVCYVGSDNTTCGTGGAPCQSCTDAGNKCVGAACMP
jgi:hypothetical protein